MHLKPFLSAMHNKQKKKFALDGFRSQFPAVSKQNLEKLLKLICVRESRDFDRIKWYVKDEYRKLILSNPEECMAKINKMLVQPIVENERHLQLPLKLRVIVQRR